MAVQWYYMLDDEEMGPISSQQLKKLASTDRLAPDDLVRRETDESWVKASAVRGLFISAKPEPIPQEAPQAQASNTDDEDSYDGEETYALQQEEIPVGRVVTPDDDEVPFLAKKKSSSSRKSSRGFDPSFIPQETPKKKKKAVAPGIDLSFGSSGGSAPAGGGYRGRKVTRTTSKTPLKPSVTGEDGEDAAVKKAADKKKQMTYLSIGGGVLALVVLVALFIWTRPEAPERKPIKVAKDDEVQTEAESAPTPDVTTEAEPAAKEPKKTEEPGDLFGLEGTKTGTDADTTEEGGGAGYTDASENLLKRDTIQIQILEATTGTLEDYTGRGQDDTTKYLFLKVSIKNLSEEKLLKYNGWSRSTKGISLKDNFGNPYKQTVKLGDKVPGRIRESQDVQEDITDILVFSAPLAKAEVLQLELPSLIRSETEPYKFQIPKSMIQPATAKEVAEPAAEDEETAKPAKKAETGELGEDPNAIATADEEPAESGDTKKPADVDAGTDGAAADADAADEDSTLAAPLMDSHSEEGEKPVEEPVEEPEKQSEPAPEEEPNDALDDVMGKSEEIPAGELSEEGQAIRDLNNDLEPEGEAGDGNTPEISFGEGEMKELSDEYDKNKANEAKELMKNKPQNSMRRR